MKVAHKALSRDKATFEELSLSEKKLWNSFETDQIYQLFIGESNTVPEFRFNWITVTGGDITAKLIPARTTMATRAPPISAPTIVTQSKPPKATTLISFIRYHNQHFGHSSETASTCAKLKIIFLSTLSYTTDSAT